MFTPLAWIVTLLSLSAFGMYCSTMVFGWTDYSSDFYDTCDYYYTLNDRLGVIDPVPWLQEKRFDLARARKMSPIVKDLPDPEGLARYALRPAASTVVHPTWNSSEIGLGDMCDWLTKCAQYYLTPASKSHRSRIHAVLVDFQHRYDDEMQGKFKKVFPWGKNWYQFSISSTLMLFYFILIAKENDPERVYAADLILNIVRDPEFSLGQHRDQANAVYMALPWIVAHWVKGNVYEAAKNPAYVYARSYIKFQTVTKRKDEGLYNDSTYITHTNVLAYGYLANMTLMSLPLVGMDNQMRNFLLDWRKCQRVLGHRSIVYAGIGLHTREKRITQFTVADSAYGVEVIPTCIFLRMYHEDYAFSMRGQVPWIAYYESDKANDDMAQYWVQCRRVFFRNKQYEPTFPDYGFVYTKYTNATKKSLVNSRVRIPTQTSTTTSFVNGPKRNTQPLKAGFVFAYGNVGILRHFYNATQMIYDEAARFKPPNERAYGRFWADEFVLYDYGKHTINIWLKILKSSKFDLIIQTDEPVLMNEHTTAAIVHMTWDCKKQSMSHSIERTSGTTDEIALVYPKGIRVVDTDNTVMLIENGKPKMAMYPDTWLDLKSNFITKYNGREYEFVFDSLTNQYWVAGQCIERA